MKGEYNHNTVCIICIKLPKKLGLKEKRKTKIPRNQFLQRIIECGSVSNPKSNQTPENHVKSSTCNFFCFYVQLMVTEPDVVANTCNPSNWEVEASTT